MASSWPREGSVGTQPVGCDSYSYERATGAGAPTDRRSTETWTEVRRSPPPLRSSVVKRRGKEVSVLCTKVSSTTIPGRSDECPGIEVQRKKRQGNPGPSSFGKRHDHTGRGRGVRGTSSGSEDIYAFTYNYHHVFRPRVGVDNRCTHKSPSFHRPSGRDYTSVYPKTFSRRPPYVQCPP